MPKYIVVHTPLRHGKEGAKKAKTYLPGDVVELSEVQALSLGSNVRPEKMEKNEKKGK